MTFRTAPTPPLPLAPRTRRIGVIGGHDRAAVQLARAASTIDCSLEHHRGHMTRVAVAELAALIERVDLVVVLTDINSHTAVIQARRIATARGRRCVLARRLSPGRLVELVAEHDRGRAAAGA
jgi:Uncharacterized protein conserved in bacteria (DUF2325)